MADNVLRHLFLGFIRLHILYHADKEAISGMELMEELQHHGYEIGPGTMYPMLHQMLEAGLLISTEKVVDGKQRKNLRITPAGRSLLRNARIKLRELASEVLDDKDARRRRKRK
ncbi:MAG: PadR family transcriptional regulator [Pirellulales bacterium]